VRRRRNISRRFFGSEFGRRGGRFRGVNSGRGRVRLGNNNNRRGNKLTEEDLDNDLKKYWVKNADTCI